MKKTTLTTIAATLVATLVACATEEPEAPPIEPPSGPNELGSWSPYYPILLSDGEPVEGAHVIVFSNFSSQSARQELADWGDSLWPTIVERFEVDPALDLDWLDSYEIEKVHLFADYGAMAQSGLAYRDGAIMRALDHENYDRYYTAEQYNRVLEHEISHVVEFLLIGSFQHRQANATWFREGIATWSGAPRVPVRTVDDLRAWQAKMADIPGGGNPIGIRTWRDFPGEIVDANRTIEYYNLFELASRYLIDPNGNGTTMAELRGYYDELGRGVPYAQAFADAFGMTPASYEAEFFGLMENYLSRQ